MRKECPHLQEGIPIILGVTFLGIPWHPLTGICTLASVETRSTLLLLITSTTFMKGSARTKDKIINPCIYAKGLESEGCIDLLATTM